MAKNEAALAKGRELYGAYGDAYIAILGGVPPWARIGKAIKALSTLYPDAEALQARWRHYLASEGKYASPERFAATAGLWGPAEGIPEARGDPGPLVDAMGILTAYGEAASRPR